MAGANSPFPAKALHISIDRLLCHRFPPFGMLSPVFRADSLSKTLALPPENLRFQELSLKTAKAALNRGLPPVPTLNRGLPSVPALNRGLPPVPTLNRGMPPVPTLNHGFCFCH